MTELMFKDGTLELIAGTRTFCVYHGLLAKVSTFFHGLSCSSVKMDDSPDDLACFLRAVHYPRYFEPPPSPTELRIVERIFRLSIKYGSTYFRRRAVSHLNSTFPMTLEGWHNTRTIPVLDLDDLSTAIRIAKEFKLDWLLPSIFYCICSHPIEITHDLFSIQYEDLKVPYFSGRQKLLKMQANVGLHIQYIITRQCQSEQCTSTVYTVADTLCSFGVAALLDFFVDNQEGLCQSCNSVLKAEGDIACQNMWRELPAVFRLPGWEDLKQKEKHTY